MQFLSFLIVRRKKWHYWNPETKLDKIDMFLDKKFSFWKFDLLLTFPGVKPKNECHHRILRSKWSIKLVSHDRNTTFSFRWPYLTWSWPWPLLSIRPILTHNLLQPLRSLLAKFGFAAIISRISVADKAKSDRLDLWPDRDLDCNLFKIYF